MCEFDKIIDRKDSGSLKWDKYAGRDILPMWVADMDFQAPPVVLDALHARIDHGVFGYPQPTGELADVCSYLEEKYQWQIDPSWIVWLPGLVSGLNIACRAFTDVDEEIITTVPIYPPFLTAPRFANRELSTVSMVDRDQRWTLDFVDVSRAITPKSRLFMLCNPHNPTGRVFGRAELTELADLCLQHNMILCSDEIHCDLILDDITHTPMAALNPDVAEITVTLMAPSKTYNIPGLCCSFAIISNSKLRGKFIAMARGIVPEVNILGFTACQAALQGGGQWLRELIDYLRDNRDLVMRTINEEIPGLSMNHVDATYLAWIAVDKPEITDPVTFFEDHGVGLSGGSYFGMKDFVRLNFGCPRATLKEALARMKNAMPS